MKLIGSFLFWFFISLISFNIFTAIVLFGQFFGSGKLKSVVSPLPKLLTDSFAKSSNRTNFWQPNFVRKANASLALELTAKSAISYDTKINALLYEKNSDEKLPIASLTKIMTAVIVLENLELNQKVTVTKSASKIGEGSMGLSEGESISIKNLLYGLMLQSGNDAGETLAQTSKFGYAGFLHLMNKKAEDLGLSNTRFTNPTGLQGDGEQYSTVKELVILTNYALKNPVFAKIVATYQHEIPATSEHKAFILFNETNLLTTYPGVRGVKTGYTDEAGMCLISYLDYNGHQIIAVLLNSQNRRSEMADLLDFSLSELGIEPPKHE